MFDDNSIELERISEIQKELQDGNSDTSVGVYQQLFNAVRKVHGRNKIQYLLPDYTQQFLDLPDNWDDYKTNLEMLWDVSVILEEITEINRYYFLLSPAFSYPLALNLKNRPSSWYDDFGYISIGFSDDILKWIDKSVLPELKSRNMNVDLNTVVTIQKELQKISERDDSDAVLEMLLEAVNKGVCKLEVSDTGVTLGAIMPDGEYEVVVGAYPVSSGKLGVKVIMHATDILAIETQSSQLSLATCSAGKKV